MAASERVLGVGVIGLGGASLAMIPKFVQNPNFRIAAAADIDAEIMQRFRKDFPDAESYDDAARLCASRNVELVYIATPNRFHAEHARMALENKKHVLIEKPMTIDIAGAALARDDAHGRAWQAPHDQQLAFQRLALPPTHRRRADARIRRRHLVAP